MPRRLGRGLSALLVGLSFSTAVAQTTYYLSANGNDANSGRSADSPFQSLIKVSSLALQPGDAILLRRGDTFRGTLFIRQSGSSASPITLDAYGSGDKPVIAGSSLVTGWTNIGNNTWQASCPGCGSRVTGVYQNSMALPLGRYPNLSDANKGYLTIQSHSGKGQITSQQALSTNWTGAEAVIRSTTWVIDRATITQQNGNTLLINNSSIYEPMNGWGYFIQDHPATLDQAGEWYYNPSSKTIRIYDSQNNPNAQGITATTASEGINLGTSSNVTVRNLKITQTLSAGVLSTGGSGLTLVGNDITNSGENGVYLIGSGSSIVAENNLIQDANNTGFQLGRFPSRYQNFTFRNNTVQRIGLTPGRGSSGDGTYSGLQSICFANSLVEYNVFDQIGYTGVSVSTSSMVRYNHVSNYCLTKTDGGGLYVSNGDRAAMADVHFQNNVVYNGMGAPEGTNVKTTSGAHGIFIDDCSYNVDVSGNSVFHVVGMGIFLRGVYNSTVKDNTCFDNGEEQLKIVANGTCAPRNIINQNNILVSKLPTGVPAAYESNVSDLSNFGQFDYNYYACPFQDQFKIQTVYNPGTGTVGKTLTLGEWQSQYTMDRNSANSPITYKIQTVTQTGATVLSYPFPTNADGWSSYGPYGNDRVEWDNTGKLDGGALKLSFGSSSGKSDAYLLAIGRLGTLRKGQTYQLLLDGIASGANKRLVVYPRQLAGSYSDLGERTTFVLNSTRQSYEAIFTATADEANAVLMVQAYEDGQTAWIDNLVIKEATLSKALNPDDYIKIVYNATGQSSSVSLDGTYRDVKNNVYNNQIALGAYSSAVLLKPLTTTPTPTTLTPIPSAVYLSDLNWTSNTNGYGPVEKDKSNGEAGAGDGRTITLNGTTYAKGLGVHAMSSVTYNLAGQYGSFTTDMGLDDEINSTGCGNVEFQIYLDGVKVYGSGNMNATTATRSVTLNVIGKKILELRVTDGGDGTSCDHGDWAGARLLPIYLSDLNWASATNGFGPAEKDMSNGEANAGDGKTITLNGTTYAKGLGVHANSSLTYNLTGQYASFTTDMGLDDEINSTGCGSVEFQIYLDGVKVYSSGSMNAATATKSVTLDVTGKQTLELRVDGGADGTSCDHGDWAGARLIRVSGGRLAATEEAGTFQAEVYPNPAHETLQVRYWAEKAGDVLLQLVSTSAQPVLQQLHSVVRGENLLSLPVSTLPRGLYILSLMQDQQRITRKVILNK